jgi:UDP-glucose 4-epimerase
MKKVLITGVAGLLGSHFSTYLLDKGYEVIGIDNLSGGYEEYVDARLIEEKNFYSFDLLDNPALEAVFEKHRPDFVYHFAAYAAEGLSPFIRNFNYKNNLLCSVNVINNCIKHDSKKIIFTSSMAVYGHGVPPFTEDHLPNPADPYGVAKYAIEMDLQLAYEQFGLNYTILRPHNVIGTRQNIWDKYRNVIGIWIRESMANRPIVIFGDGKQKRAFSDIQYYMTPFEKLMEVGNNQTFNIGADHEYELNEVAIIVQAIAREFGHTPAIEHAEERHEVKDAYCNHDKARKELDFEDKTNIEATIHEMFAWAIKQPVRETKYMEYEIEKNMYSFWK